MPDRGFGKSIWSTYYKSKRIHAGAWFRKGNLEQLLKVQMDTRRSLVSESRFGAAIVRPNWKMPGPEFGKSIWNSSYKGKRGMSGPDFGESIWGSYYKAIKQKDAAWGLLQTEKTHLRQLL